MATIYQITVTNNSPYPETMFFFQKPAVYSGGAEIYSNSLASEPMSAKPSVGTSQVQFTMELQFYAGIQTQPTPIEVGVANVSSVVEVPIDVASSSNANAQDMTEMSISSQGAIALSPPVAGSGVEGGAFRIITPTFNPNTMQYNAGLAALANGNIVLSNFITAQPNQNIDVQPIVQFYVATGSYTAGTVVNFDTVSATAALCDATGGKEDFNVTYNADGTWTVS